MQRALAEAVAGLTDGLVLIADNWRCVFLNPGAIALVAAGRDATGESAWEILPDASVGPLGGALRRCMTERVPVEAEQFCALLGRHVAARVMPTSDGGIAVYLRDVTAERRTAADLVVERARVEATFAAAQIGLNQFDEDLRIVRNNEPLAMIDGQTAAERVGHRLRDLVPDVADWIEPILQRVLDTGEPALGLELHGETPAAPGQQRTWLANYVPVRVGDAIRGVSAAVLEITDRKAIETSLRNSETQLRLAAAGAGIGTWHADLKTGRVELSAQAAVLYGLDRSALTLDTFLDPIHPDDRALVSETWQRCLAQPGPHEAEFRSAQPDNDGGERWLLCRGAVEREADGSPLRALGILIDVTARHQAAEVLRESEARFQEIANAAPVLIWISDAGRGSTWFNTAWLDFTGRTMDQELGTGWLQGVHPDDLERVIACCRDAFLRHAPLRLDYRLRRRDGAWRIIEDIGVPRITTDGRFLGHIGSAIDVTERREAEAELRRLNETLEVRIAERVSELAAANRQLVAKIEERDKVEATMRQMQRLDAVGQITAGVAHDFNNLLAVIIGNVDCALAELEEGDGTSPMQAMLQSVIEAAEKGAALTTQLLAFARRQKLDPQAVDLNAVIEGMRDLLQISSGGLVKLNLDLSHDLWPALVDPTQLALVILNLTINARDAMPQGGTLTVSTRNLPPGRPEFPHFLTHGDFVVVSVTDTGVGMDEAVKARAFEPFFTTKGPGKGSGLGLSQVYGFAKQSNGGVVIDSEPGRGTTVSVLLPRTASVPAEAGQPPRRAMRFPLREDATARGRILVVDDDNAVRQITASTLFRLGYDVVTAGSGGAALELLAHEGQTIDLLVVDFAMPGMNGVDVSREARAMYPDLPVLFVTAYADLSALDGVDPRAVLGKPYRDSELADRVAAILGMGAAPALPAPSGVQA